MSKSVCYKVNNEGDNVFSLLFREAAVQKSVDSKNRNNFSNYWVIHIPICIFFHWFTHSLMYVNNTFLTGTNWFINISIYTSDFEVIIGFHRVYYCLVICLRMSNFFFFQEQIKPSHHLGGYCTLVLVCLNQYFYFNPHPKLYTLTLKHHCKVILGNEIKRLGLRWRMTRNCDEENSDWRLAHVTVLSKSPSMSYLTDYI